MFFKRLIMNNIRTWGTAYELCKCIKKREASGSGVIFFKPTEGQPGILILGQVYIRKVKFHCHA